MSYKLVIAEKPSVAEGIAKVIGAKKREDGYFMGNGYLVSWCVGHLVSLASPEAYDKKYEKWRYEDLPIIPSKWNYEIVASTRKQFSILKKLMEREDVIGLVEATDAGREGELIFRLVYQQAGCKKPFERLWISSMEDKAIFDGFRNLKSGKEYDDIYRAALCRERADWMVGMNGTRLFSTLYGQTLNVGRVMTPTLAMIVNREKEICDFKEEPIYKLSLTCEGITVLSERLKDKEEAERLLNRMKQEKVAELIKIETSYKKEKAPSLYDLTSLQRDANRILGFTAKQTLDYAQRLYEKKWITYPRTDSRFLTKDMEERMEGLAGQIAAKLTDSKEWVLHTKQVVDDKKVSDHHAIIPTENAASIHFKNLPSGERKVLVLILARFLSSLGEEVEREEVDFHFTCADILFKAKRKSIRRKGWREIQDLILGKVVESESSKMKENNEENIPISLMNLKEGKNYLIQETKIEEGKTVAKKHFTEDSLLSAMERAGLEEMPDEVERKGIGTSATRAAIIEKLVRIGFVERKGKGKVKFLLPTEKGAMLIKVIPEELQSPVLTAEWEKKLLEIEKGKFQDLEFMREIEGMILNLVKNYKTIKEGKVHFTYELKETGTCPCCKKRVFEKQKGYFCEDRDCGFALWKENRFFETIGKKMTDGLAKGLLSDGKVFLKGCKSKKTGKSYDAWVGMKVDEKRRVVFALHFEKE